MAASLFGAHQPAPPKTQKRVLCQQAVIAMEKLVKNGVPWQVVVDFRHEGKDLQPRRCKQMTSRSRHVVCRLRVASS